MYRGAQILPNKSRADLEKDLQDLRALGANCVRWQLNANDFDTKHSWEDWTLDMYWYWLSVKLADLDWAIPICEQLGLKIMISMMSPYGGYKKTWFGARRHRIFSDKEKRDVFKEVWKHIAQRYKGVNTVLGYTIINEPLGRARQINRLYKGTLKKIRSEGTGKIVLLSSPAGIPHKFMKIKYRHDPNVWYTCNFYVPGDVTHQGIARFNAKGDCLPPKYPIGSKEYVTDYGEHELQKALRPVVKFRNKYGAKIWIGEFGCTRWSKGANLSNSFYWFEDVLYIFEDFRFNWTFHAWRECLCWSIEHSIDKDNDPCNNCGPGIPHPDNSRMQTFKHYFARNWR